MGNSKGFGNSKESEGNGSGGSEGGNFGTGKGGEEGKVSEENLLNLKGREPTFIDISNLEIVSNNTYYKYGILI
jgi:hypothetical protein